MSATEKKSPMPRSEVHVPELRIVYLCSITLQTCAVTLREHPRHNGYILLVCWCQGCSVMHLNPCLRLGGHDGGYATFLRSLRTDGRIDKLVLLRSDTPFARDISALGLKELNFRDVFVGFDFSSLSFEVGYNVSGSTRFMDPPASAPPSSYLQSGTSNSSFSPSSQSIDFIKVRQFCAVSTEGWLIIRSFQARERR